jgi:hypothetical protein
LKTSVSLVAKIVGPPHALDFRFFSLDKKLDLPQDSGLPAPLRASAELCHMRKILCTCPHPDAATRSMHGGSGIYLKKG